MQIDVNKNTVDILMNPEEIVERFLDALVDQDHLMIRALLHPNIVYTNVSLPSFKGDKSVAGLIAFGLSDTRRLQIKNHRVVAKGNVVLTERTDIVNIGPFHVGFWVCGVFKVENGKIILWRDYFDWLNVGKGLIQGLVGIGIKRLRPKF